jgi:hypothetical protein
MIITLGPFRIFSKFAEIFAGTQPFDAIPASIVEAVDCPVIFITIYFTPVGIPSSTNQFLTFLQYRTDEILRMVMKHEFPLLHGSKNNYMQIMKRIAIMVIL